MKSVTLSLMSLLLLSFLASCGKNNESGKSSYNYSNPYCSGINCSPYTGAIGPISSPYHWANSAQAENPCAAGTYYSNQRIPIQTQMMGLNIAAGDVYIGVTSYGDVAVVAGTGNRTATLSAYLCPRAANSGTGSITQPALNTALMGCEVKGITAMDIRFPDGQVAKFRDPSFGIRNPYTGQKIGNFSFCPNAQTN